MASTKRQSRRGISWPVIIVLLMLIVAVLWWRGHDYYLLSLDDRVEHPDYKALRSSGDVGYGYGVVGTTLIFANLLYLARRRFARWRLGSMRTWLDLHVFTGIAGTAFIAFHSTFKARSSIAQATVVSLIVVIITGLVGRFLYALVPKRREERMREAIANLDSHLPEIGVQLRAVLDEYPYDAGSKTLLGALRRIPHSRSIAMRRVEATSLLLDNAVHAAGPSLSSSLTAERRALVRSIRRDSRVVWAASVLRTWRGLHRFFAILMLLTVIFHIGVAWYYGYRWFWSA